MKHIASLLAALLCSGAAYTFAHPGHETTEAKLTAAAELENHVKIEVRGDNRYIDSNGIPNHATGQFPNRGNPNRISEQRHHFRVPLHPGKANEITTLRLGPFGIAVNGVLFDPGAAEFWNDDFNSGWQYEALSGKINLGMDQNNAHVQPTGSYHYHGLPKGLITKLGGDGKVLLLGYAADGFPIYNNYAYREPTNPRSSIVKMQSSFQLKKGTRSSGPKGKYDGTFVADYEYVAGVGDLDECNGRTGVTPEYPDGTYYYVLTEEFPFIPRAFRGTPDDSFRRGPQGPPPGRGMRPPRGRPPRRPPPR